MGNYKVEIEMPSFKIVDFHIHLPVAADDWLKPYRERFIARNGQAAYEDAQTLAKTVPSWLPDFNFPQPYAPFDDYKEAVKAWKKEIEIYDLEKICILTAGDNETLANVVKMAPDKMVGFAHHSMDNPDAAQQLEHAITVLGLKGYKILAPVVEHSFNEDCYNEVWKVCNQYGLPVLIHFGILGGAGGVVTAKNMSPLAIGEVAKRFSNIKFIVPHFGCGYTNDLLQLCWACPNVYVDTSGNNLWTKWTMESYTLEQLFAKFYETIGAERIIFGTDSEWFPRGFAIRYFMDQYRACKNIGMREEDIKKIFRDNALKLLKED